jgi:hypothetical protein
MVELTDMAFRYGQLGEVQQAPGTVAARSALGGHLG